MHLEVAPLRDPPQHVDIAGHEGALGDDPDVQSLAPRQPLEHPTRHAEAPLARLIRIGRGADDNRIGRADRRTGGPKEPLQIALERAQQILLDEDVPLEIAELGAGDTARVVLPTSLEVMRVARVTVRAAELAADERVERPEIHARLLR